MKSMFLVFALAAFGCQAQGVSYATATAEFQGGRWSAAYGSFVELANQGNRDAARIALFMNRYGPDLFKTRWAATDEELQAWARLATSRNKLDPEYVAGDPPVGAPRTPAKARMYSFQKAR
jgi:hypothetical protein